MSRKTKSAQKSDVLTGIEAMPVKDVTVKIAVSEDGTTVIPPDQIGDTLVEMVETTITNPKVEMTAAQKRTTKVIIAGSEVEMPLGRPVNPDSERQKRLKEQEAKRVAGEVKRGRPANPESDAFKKRQELEDRKSQPGYVARRGRPVVEGSEHQQKIKARDEKRLERAKAMGLIPTIPTPEVLAEVPAPETAPEVTTPEEVIA